MEYLTDQDIKAAKANGISYQTVYARVYRYGWKVQKAITEPVFKKEEGLWPTYREVCKQTGISQSTFYNRIDRGWSPEKAASTPIIPHGQKEHQQTKVGREEIRRARENGISENTLKHRVYTLRWKVERAITEPIHTCRRKRGGWK